jgi:hypothetical protein
MVIKATVLADFLKMLCQISNTAQTACKYQRDHKLARTIGTGQFEAPERAKSRKVATPRVVFIFKVQCNEETKPGSTERYISNGMTFSSSTSKFTTYVHITDLDVKLSVKIPFNNKILPNYTQHNATKNLSIEVPF